MENRETTEALKKLALALGVNLLERLSSNLDSEQLIAEARAVLSSQIREVIQEILQDTDSAYLETLIERIYEDLNENEIIQTIADPLAKELAKWFKEEASDLLIEGIIEQMDLDGLNELLSEKLASRMSLSSENSF